MVDMFHNLYAYQHPARLSAFLLGHNESQIHGQLRNQGEFLGV